MPLCEIRLIRHQVFTYGSLCPSSDCKHGLVRVIIRAMSLLLSPIELFDAEKLEILQQLDRYRKWQSLDEKRYCLACGHIIDGRGILVVGGTRGTGPLRLICPTQRCHAIPMDWAIPSEQVLDKMSMMEEKKSAPPRKFVQSREKFSARLRKLTTHFRRAA